jgi:iron complex transport system substrate-binding protein
VSSVRIVSFLPAATEIACALGLEDSIVGVSHECDYPPSIKSKPVVVRDALSLAARSPRDIDERVAAAARDGVSMYAVDEELLRELKPDLILTQDLCQVCAPSGNEITRLIASLDPRPDVLHMTPRCLADIEKCIFDLAEMLDIRKVEEIVGDMRRRLREVELRVANNRYRPRVFFAEWVDPIYCAGHWVPEQIQLAGGEPVVARPGGESVRVTRDEIIAAQPEIVIVGPCGYSLSEAEKQAALFDIPGARVVAVDANSYFARPGPRLVDGVELLADIIAHGQNEISYERGWSGNGFHGRG